MIEVTEKIEEFIQKDRLDFNLLNQIVTDIPEKYQQSVRNCILTGREEVKQNNSSISSSLSYIQAILSDTSDTSTQINTRLASWKGLIFSASFATAILLDILAYYFHKSCGIAILGFIGIIIIAAFFLVYEKAITTKDMHKILSYLKFFWPVLGKTQKR